MRRKIQRISGLFRWPVVVAAICGLFIFVAASPMLSQPVYAQGPPPTPNNPGTGLDDADQDATSPTLECEILNFNPLSWFGCPVIVGLQETVVLLNKGIDAMMTINVDDPKTGLFTKQYKDAWDQFRIISIGLVIVAGLIMLASQAFGFELLDAYTVKKIMPRLILAVIFIALSWDILKFLVTLSNDAGNSIRAIIYQPFKGAATTGGFGDALQLGNWTKLVSALVGGGAIVTLGLAGLLSFVATAFLAILIGFVVLLVRQMVITMLVLTAPFAIALYILPNTQKFFDFWKGALISMLVVFPIISAFIATGRVFAIVAYGNGNTAEVPLIQQLSAFFAYFIPYAAIPFAFKLAGGLIATVAGIANDRGKGGFDRLSKYRQGKTASNFEKMKGGERFKGNNWASRKFNDATFNAGLVGRSGFSKARRQAAREQRRTLLAGQHAKSDDAQSAQFNDNLLQAQTYMNEHEARRNLAKDFGVEQKERAKYYSIDETTGQAIDAKTGNAITDEQRQQYDNDARKDTSRSVENYIQQAKANGGFSRARSQYAANQLAATGTGYTDQEQMLKTIARVAGGNENTAAALIGSARGAGDKAGRYDLKAGFGDQLEGIKQAMASGQIKGELMTKLDIDSAQGASAASRAQAKPTATKNAVRNLTTTMQEDIKIAKDESFDEKTRQFHAERAGSIGATLKNMEGAKMFGSEQYAQALYTDKGGMESSRKVTENVKLVTNVNQEVNPSVRFNRQTTSGSAPGGQAAGAAAPPGGQAPQGQQQPQQAKPTPLRDKYGDNVVDMMARRYRQEHSSRSPDVDDPNIHHLDETG